MTKTKAELFLAAIRIGVARDGMAVVLPLEEAAEKLSWRYFFALARLEGKESDVSRQRYGRMSKREARRIMAEVEGEILRHTEGAQYRLDLPGGPMFEEGALAAAAGNSCEYGGPDEPTWPRAASRLRAVAA